MMLTLMVRELKKNIIQICMTVMALSFSLSANAIRPLLYQETHHDDVALYQGPDILPGETLTDPKPDPEPEPFYNFISDGICYYLRTDYTAVVTYLSGNKSLNSYHAAGNVTIPSTVERNGIKYKVTWIGDRAFYGCYFLKDIALPEGIVGIGKKAFEDTGIESITIPKNVLYIEDEAFAYCRMLTLITLPEGLKELGEHAFDNCISLSSAKLPGTLEEIKDYTFLWCSSLTKVVLSEKTVKLGNYTFCGCSSLKSIAIPNSVTHIGKHAFEECFSLESVEMSKNIAKIDESAFAQCFMLKAIDLGEKLTYLGDAAFWGCVSLKSIGSNTVVPCSKVYIYFVSTPDSDFDPSISPRLNGVGFRTFRNCVSLTSVKLANDIEGFGREAFYGCASLTSVNIPGGVKKLEEKTFKGCGILRDIVLPDQLKTIDREALYGCNGLKSIRIPSSVKKIGSRAIICRNLREVHVESINPSSCYPGYGQSFGTSTRQRGVLYVPEGSVSTYQEARGWNEFANIVTEGTSGIEKVETSNLVDGKISLAVGPDGIQITGLSPTMPIAIYTLDGILCHSSVASDDSICYRPVSSGVYIVRIGQYTAKVLVK